MKFLTSSCVLAVCLALCGAVASATTLIAFSGFSGTANAKLLSTLDDRAVALISAQPGFKAVRVHLMCDDPGTSAASVGAAYYLSGTLAAGGHSMSLRLYHVGNLIPIRTVTATLANGKFVRAQFASLLDRSHWSKASSPAGSC